MTYVLCVAQLGNYALKSSKDLEYMKVINLCLNLGNIMS